MIGECSMCNFTKAVIKHHISYSPPKMALVCHMCHSHIHLKSNHDAPSWPFANLAVTKATRKRLFQFGLPWYEINRGSGHTADEIINMLVDSFEKKPFKKIVGETNGKNVVQLATLPKIIKKSTGFKKYKQLLDVEKVSKK